MNSIRNIKRIRSAIDRKGQLYFSRRKAKTLRAKIVKEKGHSKINSHLKRRIKLYSKDVFGSSSFWPWLALYTEIRGEFKEGWLPDDYYTVYMLKEGTNYFSGYVSDFKTLDHKLFPDVAIEPLFIIAMGNIYDSEGNKLTRDEFGAILDTFNDEIVVKKDFGLGGKQVRILHSNKFENVNLTDKDSYVVQPKIRQHELINRIYPNSVNTLRVVTSIDNAGKVSVKYAKLRFGTGTSRVDNGSSGGWSCMIDSTGRLNGQAFSYLGEEMGVNHPTTNFKFRNAVIPNYKEILDVCISNHHRCPYGKIIGWDMAIDGDAKPVLVEWNLDPLIWSSEALYGPFWHDDVTNLPSSI